MSNSSLNFTECPLTLAAQLEGCAELIKVLKSGGAHLDFRTKDGITALHKAVRSKNHTALIVSITHTHTQSYRKADSSLLFLLLHQLPACKLPLWVRRACRQAISGRGCLSNWVQWVLEKLLNMSGLTCTLLMGRHIRSMALRVSGLRRLVT